MGSYQLENIGEADVSKKTVKCSFSMDSSEFFSKFGDLAGGLSGKARDAISKSIDSGKDEKLYDNWSCGTKKS